MLLEFAKCWPTPDNAWNCALVANIDTTDMLMCYWYFDTLALIVVREHDENDDRNLHKWARGENCKKIMPIRTSFQATASDFGKPANSRTEASDIVATFDSQSFTPYATINSSPSCTAEPTHWMTSQSADPALDGKQKCGLRRNSLWGCVRS